MANRYYTSEFVRSFHAFPVELDCNFTVAVADTGGLGLTGLKGGGIANVYMHTSATPATGSPNPASGLIYVSLQDTYFKYYFGGFQMHSPVTGSSINISGSTVLTVGNVYQIVTLGTSTAANWAAVGFPAGDVPQVGMSFIASVTGGGTGTGTVKAVGNSGITAVELVGSPSLSVGSLPGPYLVLQCLGATDSSTTTLIPKAPADGTVIRLWFYLSNSSVLVQGE